MDIAKVTGVVLALLTLFVVSATSKSGHISLPVRDATAGHSPATGILVSSSRKRRNVAQLAHLVDNYTPYRSSQLLKHGNWCGYGGDRAHDGSIRDQCDGCCRTHDFCYEQLLSHTTEGLGPNDIISNLQVLGVGGPLELQLPHPHPHPGGKHFLNFDLPHKSRRCVPYVDLYRYSSSAGVPRCSEVGGICSRAACDCDMDFVNCLRRSSCQMQG